MSNYVTEFIEKHFSSKEQTQIQDIANLIKNHFKKVMSDVLVVHECFTDDRDEYDTSYESAFWYKIKGFNELEALSLVKLFDNVYQDGDKYVSEEGISSLDYDHAIKVQPKGFRFLRKLAYAFGGLDAISPCGDITSRSDFECLSCERSDPWRSYECFLQGVHIACNRNVFTYRTITRDFEKIGQDNLEKEFDAFCKLRAIEIINCSSKRVKEIGRLTTHIVLHSPILCKEPQDFQFVHKLMNTVSDIDMIKLLAEEKRTENKPLIDKQIRKKKALIEKNAQQALENLEKQKEMILKQKEEELQLLKALKKQEQNKDNKVDVKTIEKDDKTTAHDAVTALIDVLEKNMDTIENGITELGNMFINRCCRKLEALIKEGADINIKDKKGLAPLDYLKKYPEVYKIVKERVEKAIIEYQTKKLKEQKNKNRAVLEKAKTPNTK